MSHSPRNDSCTLRMWPFLDFECKARQIPNIMKVFSKMADILQRPSQR